MVQSVSRALALLQEVARCGDWIGVRELARAAGLKAPTAQNLLKTLLAHSFLEFDEKTRRYRIGLAAMRLAEAADPIARMADFARPFVERLRNELSETVAVLTLVQGRAVVVDWREAEHELAVTLRQRIVETPHFMASGQVLLAFQETSVRERYAHGVDYGEPGLNMPRSPAETLALLSSVRERGYAATEDMRGSGIVAVAAPVFDAADQVVLALACSAPAARCDSARRKQMLTLVRSLSAEMTQKLGGQARCR